MHTGPSPPPSCSTSESVAVCGHPDTSGLFRYTTLRRSMANVVTNDAASVVGPETAFAASVTVTRQNSVVSAGRSAGGVKDVRDAPSLTVPATRTGLNAAFAAISKRYVSWPTG